LRQIPDLLCAGTTDHTIDKQDNDMAILWTVLLIISVFFFWLLGILGLPGNWLMLIATAIYALAVPTDATASLWWIVMTILLVLAIAGEVIEMFASAHGVRKHGGSKRSALLSFAGALIGAIIGAIIGTGVMPIIGSLLGALLLSGAGALVGAFLGEQWIGRSVDDSLQVGQAAFWARLAGTAAKMVIGCVMLAVVLVALGLDLSTPREAVPISEQPKGGTPDLRTPK
tara:strand:- start:2142 stop:2825 length:684 start_codon:yes stop_codon:yes gene_type:complete